MNRRIHIAKVACIVLITITPLHAWSQALVSNKMPTIEVVGTGVLHRTSEKKDASGLFLPPWTNVEVTNVFGFKIQPRVGIRATFVPVDIDLEPFELKLQKSVIQDGCDKSSPKWWSAEFEGLTDQRVIDIQALPGRNAEYPFDVVVIYPAVSSARQIPKSQLRADMLPPRLKLATVKSAIDVSGDGMPDLVVTEHCCTNDSKTDDCDLTCGATYKRSGKKWLKLDTSTPC